MSQRALFRLLLLLAAASIVLVVWLGLGEPPAVHVTETVEPIKSLPAPPEDGERTVLGKGTLRGKVVDGNTGDPIPGARVEALMPYERKLEGEELPMWGALKVHKAVTTDADGTFAVSDLPPNYWNLWVEKRRFSWTTVPRARFDETHEIKLYPGCRVRGRVVYPDGTPAHGVRIEYTPQGTHSEVFGRYAAKGLDSYYSTTRDDGTFEYRDLPPGKFTVEVYPENHVPAPWARERPLAPGEERDLGDKVLFEGFSMKVNVKWRGTDVGVPGAEVVVRPMGDPMPRTKIGQRRRTDAKGVARFQGLGGQVMPNPKFMVAVNVEGVGPVQPDSGGLLEPNQEVTIYLRKDGVVKGRVVGPDGEPISGFFVDLVATSHRTRQLRVTGMEGDFVAHAIPEGDYEVQIHDARFVDAVRPVSVVGGEEHDIGTVRLQQGAEIYGTVTRSDGAPLEGVIQVRLARRNADGSYEELARTAAHADGVYRLPGVPIGTWWIRPESITDPSSTTEAQEVTVAPGTGGIQKDLVVHGEGFLKLKFMDYVEEESGARTIRHVHAPPTYLVDTASGREVRWTGEGTRLRGGRYEIWVETGEKDEKGAPKRRRVGTERVQEGETVGPIEIRLYE